MCLLTITTLFAHIYEKKDFIVTPEPNVQFSILVEVLENDLVFSIYNFSMGGHVLLSRSD